MNTNITFDDIIANPDGTVNILADLDAGYLNGTHTLDTLTTANRRVLAAMFTVTDLNTLHANRDAITIVYHAAGFPGDNVVFTTPPPRDIANFWDSVRNTDN